MERQQKAKEQELLREAIVPPVQPATARSLEMNLAAGSYRFTVQAINANGNSPLSPRSNLVAAQ